MVLVEAFSRATVMTADFKGFPHFEVVGKTLFAFILHRVDNFEIIHIECVRAVFVVLRQPRMVVLLVLNGFFVFLPSGYA